MHIFLTPKGERFMEENIAPIIVMENQTCSQMNAKELDTLLLLTKKYLDCLRTQAKELTIQGERKQ